jgi:hypothetical protein
MTLSDLLARDREPILAAAAHALARAHLPSYEAAGEAESRARLARLFDLVAAAVAERNLTPARRFAAAIAAERHAAGFDLAEVQTAINALEEAIWSAIVAEIEPAGLAEAFGLASTVLGATKDRLATAYLELATRARVPALDLGALFAGTDG